MKSYLFGISLVLENYYQQLSGEFKMSKNYKQITDNINKALGEIRQTHSDVLQAFHALSQAATKDNALDKKTKELVAMGIAIAKQCDGCIGFHTQTLIKLGVTREEFIDVLGMAVYMGGGPSLMYAAEAIQAFDELSH